MDSLTSPAPAPASTTTPPEDKDEPIIAPIPPLHHQIIYFLSIWSFKTILNTGLFLRKHLTAPPSSQLTPLVKPYPVRPTLKNRIFLPPSLVPNAKYPVYFSIHGGGWAIGSPEIDDGFCSSFCRKNNIIVVSLDYRKSPTYKFPFAVTDTTALVLAVLADSSLPIDGEKISIGGFSAGGNLAFAACQDEELKGKINGLVGFYPVLNSAESRETKEDRRPKGEDVPRDGVAWSAMFVDWGYVPQGQDRRDPLLSPRFAGRDVFPGNVYLVGAEWDMLCGEAEDTAENLVVDGEERKEVKGEGWNGWVQGGVRWEKFLKRSHAFMEVKEWGTEKEEERMKLVEELCDRVGTWLRDEVWTQ